MANPIVALEGRVNYSDITSSKGPKVLFVVLILLGVVGVLVATTGLASYGGHQQWWPAGGLSQLAQVDAIIMMGTGWTGGIACLIAGIVGMVRMKQRWDQLDTRLGEGGYTYLRQDNGLYTLIAKRSALEVLKTDIDILGVEKEGLTVYRSAAATIHSLQQEFNLDPEHYKPTVLFPDDIQELKRQLRIQYAADEYRKPMERILDDPAFKADPVGYLDAQKQDDKVIQELQSHQMIKALPR